MARIGANIRISGIVQGVGFRPFIHKQITDHSLCGFIRNTSKGVEIEIEGEPERVRLFIDELWTKAPALAVIKDVKAEYYDELKNYTDFQILSSQVLPGRQALISPDVGLCEDCRRELFDPENRRYRYPFINCTNCGPRYTIVKDVPYDRPLTSMGAFPMCGPCDKEYHEITDRRYHAQPTCCPDCGPRVEYFRSGRSKALGEKALAEAVKLLERGGILCVKGLGGMHLACRADQPESVKELRRRKEREEKPFAVMARDIESARLLCEISPAEEKLLVSRQKPIVLLKKKDPGACLEISENDRLGVMLPYTPLHELLLQDGPPLLIMTSANLSDRPIIKDNGEALQELSDIADGFLLHDRDIVARCDDSLLWELDGEPYFTRRSRGWAPEPIEAVLPGPALSLLACGAEQKASFALSKCVSSAADGGSEESNGTAQVFLSPHIGEGKNFETLSHYEDTIKHYENLFDILPQALICDLHPDYLTTRYAEKRAAAELLPLIKVQHHHAHMAACLADNGLSGRTLGIIWDGTGYGTEGTVWGGEFLLGDYKSFTRAASLRPFRLPGGDLCTKEIRRITLSLLTDALEWAVERDDGNALSAVDKTLSRFQALPGAEAARFQLSQGINAPFCSSIGRLFDGVSALLGIRDRSSYEGQAAVLLEAAAKSGTEAALPYAIMEKSGRLLFDERPMTAALCRLLQEGAGTDELAARFMNTLVEMAADLAGRIREKEGFEQIVLSGGSFQNLYILTRLQKKLEAEGFRVYRHCRVSPNDEGIPLGQLAVGAAIISREVPHE
jgi:hydrogenase maturation protein HypF